MSNSSYFFHLSELLTYGQLSEYQDHLIPDFNQFAIWIVANLKPESFIFELLQTMQNRIIKVGAVSCRYEINLISAIRYQLDESVHEDTIIELTPLYV